MEKKDYLLSYIDPYGKNPSLINKTEEELEIIFGRIITSKTSFKLKQYEGGTNLTSENIKKRIAINKKEAELLALEEQLKKSEEELKEAYRLVKESQKRYVRPPDPVVRERLIDDSPYLTETDNFNNQEDELQMALRLSREEHERQLQEEREQRLKETEEYERQRLIKEQEFAKALNESSCTISTSSANPINPTNTENTKLQETEEDKKLNFIFKISIPEEFSSDLNEEFLIELCKNIKDNNFTEVTTLINKINPASLRWLGMLVCEDGKKLKKKLIDRDPTCYDCIAKLSN